MEDTARKKPPHHASCVMAPSGFHADESAFRIAKKSDGAAPQNFSI
jgi:hypothetical protein